MAANTRTAIRTMLRDDEGRRHGRELEEVIRDVLPLFRGCRALLLMVVFCLSFLFLFSSYSVLWFSFSFSPLRLPFLFLPRSHFQYPSPNAQAAARIGEWLHGWVQATVSSIVDVSLMGSGRQGLQLQLLPATKVGGYTMGPKPAVPT